MLDGSDAEDRDTADEGDTATVLVDLEPRYLLAEPEGTGTLGTIHTAQGEEFRAGCVAAAAHDVAGYPQSNYLSLHNGQLVRFLYVGEDGSEDAGWLYVQTLRDAAFHGWLPRQYVYHVAVPARDCANGPRHFNTAPFSTR